MGEACECCGLNPCRHARCHVENIDLKRFVQKSEFDTLKAERDELKHKLEFLNNNCVSRGLADSKIESLESDLTRHKELLAQRDAELLKAHVHIQMLQEEYNQVRSFFSWLEKDQHGDVNICSLNDEEAWELKNVTEHYAMSEFGEWFKLIGDKYDLTDLDTKEKFKWQFTEPHKIIEMCDCEGCSVPDKEIAGKKEENGV